MPADQIGDRGLVLDSFVRTRDRQRCSKEMSFNQNALRLFDDRLITLHNHLLFLCDLHFLLIVASIYFVQTQQKHLLRYLLGFNGLAQFTPLLHLVCLDDLLS